MVNRICWRDECSRPVDKWGMCTPHYEHHRDTYRPKRAIKVSGTSEERFYAYLHKGADDECWIWGGSLNSGGYGVMRLSGRDAPVVRVHRFAWELLVGPIPEGLELDHLPVCRMRPCCNPKHLEPVTGKVNTLRGVGVTAQNARKTECPKGHLYDEKNTYVTPDGHRQCVICQRETSALTAAERTRAHRERSGRNSGVGKGGYQKERTHCPQGHPYDEANTIREGNRRRCRECVNKKKQAWRDAKKS